MKSKINFPPKKFQACEANAEQQKKYPKKRLTIQLGTEISSTKKKTLSLITLMTLSPAAVMCFPKEKRVSVHTISNTLSLDTKGVCLWK
jgi:hypothetical protein